MLNDEYTDEYFIAERPNPFSVKIVLKDETWRRINEALKYAPALLHFSGEPGTGKTMASEAIACRLNKNILNVKYGYFNRKIDDYKMILEALIRVAKNQNAILYFDNAEHLLMPIIDNPVSEAQLRFNSLKTNLMNYINQFDGIAIFSTDLSPKYCKNVYSEIIDIEFNRSNVQTRKQIWKNHLFPTEGTEVKLNIPSAGDWNIDELAEKYEFVGRDIRNAVKKACVSAVTQGKSCVSQEDLLYACEAINGWYGQVELANRKITTCRKMI